MSMRHFLNFSKLRKIGHLTFEKKEHLVFDVTPKSFLSNFWGSCHKRTAYFVQISFYAGRAALACLCGLFLVPLMSFL